MLQVGQNVAARCRRKGRIDQFADGVGVRNGNRKRVGGQGVVAKPADGKFVCPVASTEIEGNRADWLDDAIQSNERVAAITPATATAQPGRRILKKIVNVAPLSQCVDHTAGLVAGQLCRFLVGISRKRIERVRMHRLIDARNAHRTVLETEFDTSALRGNDLLAFANHITDRKFAHRPVRRLCMGLPDNENDLRYDVIVCHVSTRSQKSPFGPAPVPGTHLPERRINEFPLPALHQCKNL